MVPGSALVSTHHQPVPVGCQHKWYGGPRDQFGALTGGPRARSSPASGTTMRSAPTPAASASAWFTQRSARSSSTARSWSPRTRRRCCSCTPPPQAPKTTTSSSCCPSSEPNDSTPTKPSKANPPGNNTAAEQHAQPPGQTAPVHLSGNTNDSHGPAHLGRATAVAPRPRSTTAPARSGTDARPGRAA
jgi:hypothetical protein